MEWRGDAGVLRAMGKRVHSVDGDLAWVLGIVAGLRAWWRLKEEVVVIGLGEGRSS